jgi:Ca2+-binding RTX toxin-like protein
LLGGAGNDFASYAGASDTVRATLGEGTNFGVAEGSDGSDLLSSIEGLIGGNSNDTLAGSSATNTPTGGDWRLSTPLFGGGGNDWVSYAGTGAGHGQP